MNESIATTSITLIRVGVILKKETRKEKREEIVAELFI